MDNAFSSRVLLSLATVVLLGGLRTAQTQQPPVREGYALTRDSVRLFFRVWGTRGDTIIYVHGGPGSRHDKRIFNLLPLADRHVLIGYDQRAGTGKSDIGDTTRVNPATHVEDLEAVRVHFGIGRVTLLGTSWGAALSTMYAAAHPNHVAQLILVGPMPPARLPYGRERAAAVAARLAAVCTQLHGSDTTAAPWQQCAHGPQAGVRVFYADTLNMARDLGRDVEDRADQTIGNRKTLRALGDWDHRPAMKQVQSRALVIEGAQSPVPLNQMRVWAENLPRGRLLLIDRVGHAYPYIERPDVFFPAVEDFLAGRWPRGAVVVRPEQR